MAEDALCDRLKPVLYTEKSFILQEGDLVDEITVQALSELEAFALMADDLKFVFSQFPRLHSKQFRHTFRKKLEQSLLEEESKLQNVSAKEGVLEYFNHNHVNHQEQ
ncbi:hypothetical protein Leryth_027280 [Lithospermum erythrorhizon]|nr:hypothetical protein Leryth_027280 [Lithospermum erythrorhizon]